MYKKYFLTGMISFIPVYITYWIIQKIFFLVAVPGKKIIFNIFSLFGINYSIDSTYVQLFEYIAGFILTLLFLSVLGLVVSNVIGKRLYSLFESILNRIPLVNKIYSSIKQIISTFSGDSKQSFQKVVLIEYPRRGLWTMAMVTGESKNKKNEEFYTLFVPSTPNPTTGYMILVSKNDIVNTDISVEEGLKVILSGGLIAPDISNIP